MKRLIGVGVGPGDPELVTVKAVRVLREADVVLVPVLAGPDPGAAETAPGQPATRRAAGTRRARPGRDDHPRLRRRGPGQAPGVRAERHRRRHAAADRGLAGGRRRGGGGVRRGRRHDRVRHPRRPQPVLHVQLPGPDRPRSGPRGDGGDRRRHHRHAGPGLPGRHLAGRGHRTGHARPAQRRRQRPGPGAGLRRNRRRLQGRRRRQPRARRPAGPPARGRPPGRRRHRRPPRPPRRTHRPRRRSPCAPSARPRHGPQQTFRNSVFVHPDRPRTPNHPGRFPGSAGACWPTPAGTMFHRAGPGRPNGPSSRPEPPRRPGHRAPWGGCCSWELARGAGPADAARRAGHRRRRHRDLGVEPGAPGRAGARTEKRRDRGLRQTPDGGRAALLRAGRRSRNYESPASTPATPRCGAPSRNSSSSVKPSAWTPRSCPGCPASPRWRRGSGAS